ncbi:M48 family metallopeptidase [Methanobacterium sp.]|uniref:M48 family metallopeptidase n=1 Tax=Methanobacterium sp. TaxID=2164 RepID=UPI003C78D7E1
MIEIPETQTFLIDFDISPEYHDEVLSFINENYLKVKPEYFSNVKIIREDNANRLLFTARDPAHGFQIEAGIKSGNPVELKLIPGNGTPSKFTESVKDDIYFMVHLFEDNIRSSTIYFSWVEGERIIPEQPPTAKKRTGDQLFTSSLLLVYLLFFAFNIVLFFLFGLYYAVALILLSQLVIVLFSNKILAYGNKWNVTSQNPYVHILEYQLPSKEFKEFREKFGKETVTEIKKEIYDRTFTQGITPTCKLGDEVLEKYGFRCNPYRSLSKTVNVYDIVKRAADSFGLPMPKIVISNTMLANAAATGPSPNKGLVLITTGLLVQLNEDEILSVLGHEMGHLKGRDPLILFSIISGEFILRFTVLFPIVIINPILYIIVAMAVIFFVAKFFETRADLLSAMKIGQPDVLAEALRKIAYQRLQMEKVGSKIPRWLSWDTHPPVYFRIDRLKNMRTPVTSKNPLVQSARDVVNGFLASFR